MLSMKTKKKKTKQNKANDVSIIFWLFYGAFQLTIPIIENAKKNYKRAMGKCNTQIDHIKCYKWNKQRQWCKKNTQMIEEKQTKKSLQTVNKEGWRGKQNWRLNFQKKKIKMNLIICGRTRDNGKSIKKCFALHLMAPFFFLCVSNFV